MPDSRQRRENTFHAQNMPINDHKTIFISIPFSIKEKNVQECSITSNQIVYNFLGLGFVTQHDATEIYQ